MFSLLRSSILATRPSLAAPFSSTTRVLAALGDLAEAADSQYPTQPTPSSNPFADSTTSSSTSTTSTNSELSAAFAADLTSNDFEVLGTAFLSTIRRTAKPAIPVHSRGPAAGRTIKVFAGDLQGAFRNLNSVLARNNVKRQYRQQMFFERATDKRVRLKSQRHRKRFKEAVQELIMTVKDMKKRGY